MNKQRRNQITNITTELIQIKNSIEIIKNKLQFVYDEEDLAFSNMPENLQCSIRGMDSEEAIDNMNEALEHLDEALNNLNEII